MPIIRIQKRENPYVQIDRAAIEDNRLSWKARGILAYLLSKPDDWHIHIFDIVNHGPDGRESITTAMRELEKFGYAKLVITRNEMGQIIQKEWAVSETPTYNGFSEVGSTEIGKPLNRQTAPISNNNKYSKNNTLPDSQAKSGRKRKTDIDLGHAPCVDQDRDADAYTFAEFWNDYGHKVGSKAKTEVAFNKLRNKDKEAIRATLPLYLRGTTTKDTARAGGNFRPLRQYPLTYLNGRVWETYAEQAAEQNEQPTPYDDNYRAYLDWVKGNYPAVLQQTAQLSKAQFVTYKSTSYVRGVRDIGQQAELNTLRRAHEEYTTNVTLPAKYPDVFSYHCALIEKRIKARQV